MSRTRTGSMSGEIAAKQLAPVLFVELDFADGFVRMWNGRGPLTWDGKAWAGGGELMAISPMEESRDIEATTLNLSLSGVPSALVAMAYGSFSQGRPAKIWLGAFDMPTGTVIDAPVAIFQGRMDTIGDDDDGQTARITVSVETRLADLKRLRARYLTDQDQQRLFPGDRALRYMPSLQDRPVYWGVDGATPDLQPLP